MLRKLAAASDCVYSGYIQHMYVLFCFIKENVLQSDSPILTGQLSIFAAYVGHIDRARRRNAVSCRWIVTTTESPYCRDNAAKLSVLYSF